MKRTVNKYHMWWFKGENTQRRLKSNLLNVVFEFWIWKGGGGGCHLESFKFWGEKFVGTLKL